jgi:membrane protease YdiL (CAAX protease family)
MNDNQIEPLVKKWGNPETVFVAWVGSALLALVPVMVFLQGAFPLFTVLWLTVPLLVVLRTRDANRVGFRKIPGRVFISTTAINLGALLLVAIMVEPWSHSYQALVKGAIASLHPDTTFAWLIRFKGFTAWSGMLFYSGLVTIFGEELFFRGWLLQWLQRRMDTRWAIILQAALFSLPQLLAALLLSPLQGVIYTVIYSWLAVGVIGGWAAARTNSIWPSWMSTTLWNIFLVAWVL